MILPKGTLDYTQKGGEGQVKKIISGITTGACTGYLLVRGNLESDEGNMDKVIGQMVFKEGKPLLCESIVDNESRKGEIGAFPLLSVMMDPSSEIELHSKIDVGPPYAFFKECRMENELNLDTFIKHYKKRLDDLSKKKKERQEEDKRMKQMISDIEEWISIGYQIEELETKSKMGYRDMFDYYNDISARISRSKEVVEWLDSIKVVDLQEEVAKLKGLSMNISDMAEIERSVKHIESALNEVNEKRNEIIKWVNLWKEEGFNTESVERKLNDDLDSTWNSMANFMDSIQQLKEYREELDSISKDKSAKGFSKEISQIEYLLNDPNEIPAAEAAITSLKEVMENERSEKHKMLEEAKAFAKGGFNIARIEDSNNLRAKDMEGLMDILRNSVSRIKEIGALLNTTDRRDLSTEIDELRSSMNDPFALDDYESLLNEIQERILSIDKERDDIRSRVDDIAGQGYNVGSIEPFFERPLPDLRSALDDLTKSVKKLSVLSDELSNMDGRWLEEKFEEARSILKDPTSLDRAEEMVKTIKKHIQKREEAREKVRHDLDRWRSDGFIVSRLEEVIEEGLPAFSIVHEEMQKNVTACREMLKELQTINTRFFQGDAEELRSLLMDPFEIERARKNLTEIREKVQADTARRLDIKKRLEELRKDGFKIDSVKEIVETPTLHLEDAFDDMETKVARLKEASSLIDKWDRVEASWLHPGIEELKKHLKDIGNHQGALEHFKDMEDLIEANRSKRDKIRERVGIWKDAGYNVRALEKKIDASIEDLDREFEENLKQIIKLEGFQERFDTLDVKHFRKEAEEIEFKLNDPGLVDEISVELMKLESTIEDDKNKRYEMIKKIDDYMATGFQAADKIRQYLDQDMSILELEMNNFDKEVQMFKKFMGSTGFKPAAGPEKTDDSQKKEARIEVPAPVKNGTMIEDAMYFENLIVGNSNRFAVKASETVADKPLKTYNPLFIYGSRGAGKTHILHSIKNRIVSRDENTRVGLFLGDELIGSGSEKDDPDGLNPFENFDVILLDDVHALAKAGEGLPLIDKMIEDLLGSNKQVVFSSLIPPSEIGVFSSQLRSRLESGLVVDIRPLSDDIKGPLLVEMLKRKGLELDESLRDRLLTSINIDTVAMTDVIDVLVRCSAEKDGLNIDTVNSAILELSREDPKDDDLTGALERAIGSVKKVEGGSGGRSFLCEACGNSVDMDASSCPKCGASFEAAVYQCPRCSIEVPAGSAACPGCGAEFVIDDL